MGVPAFFRWLSRKYPSVVTECIEERPRDYDGNEVEIDSSQPNPNGVEFDNLYLDMNGIIHPCTHPEDKPAPKNEDEMMVAIFEAIDRLFRIVRPRKLLYMAIDGVAPRAKMNQQRSRRFRASKETNEKIHEIARIKAELRARGVDLPEVRVDEEHFDSNCITPGTPFMARLSDCLHYYIYDRLNNDPGWRNIKIILSDANVPGEGEHKIMDYIRKQRAQPDHDPNTRHCLCGADADLIMLGLATHEVNFTIIREEFKPNKPRPCSICGRLGHEIKECTGEERDYEESGPPPGEVNFIFVRLNVLREYLKRELAMPYLPFEYDFERAVDDWVFMCFFVGNDFLPHLPSLEIREGAIDRLIRLYKNCVYRTKGFLTENGNVDLEKVQIILSELGKVEDEIFKQRQVNEKRFRAQNKVQKQRNHAPDFSLLEKTQFAPRTLNNVTPVVNARQEAYEIRKAGIEKVGFEKFLEESGLEKSLDTKRGVKRKYLTIESPKFDDDKDEDDEPPDEVRLWEDGFKDRYYESKFDVGKNNIEFRSEVAKQYVRGLCWVMKYYYQGCCSWEWYFPYHYAPFASDFFDVGSVDVSFPYDTKPFNPLEQLMSVFPPASCSHIPEPWRCLMLNKESPIIDFYPDDFKIDLNGKKFAWQGVALLPFVEEKRLFTALESFYQYLTPAERKRNELGSDRLYIGITHTSFPFVRGLYDRCIDPKAETRISMDGMQGTILLSDDNVKIGGTLQSPIKGLSVLLENKVLCVRYYNNKYQIGFVFQANRLKGAIAPPSVLKPSDLNAAQSRNWRPQIGMAPATQRAYISNAGHRMLNFQTLHINRDDNNRYQRDRDRNLNESNYNRYEQPRHHNHSSNYYNNSRNNSFNSNNNSYNSNQSYNSYISPSESSFTNSSSSNSSYGSMNSSYNSNHHGNVHSKYRNPWPPQTLPIRAHLPPNNQDKRHQKEQQRSNNQYYNNNNYRNRY